MGDFCREQVHTLYLPQSSMPSTPAVRADIEREWRTQRQRARETIMSLFSGRLFRLCGHRVDGAGDLHLTLGRTTYKQYVGTRAPGFYGTRPRAALANPLGVCATITTGDGGIVLSRRWGVDLGNGRYDVIGGFLERGKDMDPFAGMAREIEEEVGLTVSSSDLRCLGLIYDCLHPHYDLCFAVRTALSFAELARLQPVEREVSYLQRLGDSAESLSTFLATQRERLVPTGAACLTLYTRLRWQVGVQS